MRERFAVFFEGFTYKPVFGLVDAGKTFTLFFENIRQTPSETSPNIEMCKMLSYNDLLIE